MDWNIPALEDLEHAIWRCTACGTCKVSYDFGPPPRHGEICPAGVEFGFEGYLASKGKIAFSRGILSGELEWDESLAQAVYRCTLCGGCQSQCQLDHKPYLIEIFESMRRKAVAAGVGPLPSQRIVGQSLATYENPYQAPRRVRADWTRPFKKAGKPIRRFADSDAEILFYVGCTGAYNQGARGIPTATASIFQKLDLDFAILGEEERCCGSTAMRIGLTDVFTGIAEANMETFARLRDERGLKTIVSSCAGCFRALKKDYSLADGYEEAMEGIRIVHTIDFLHELYQEGRLPLQAPTEGRRVVTYHDPCHTGRHLNVFSIDEDGSQQYEGAYLGLSEEECVYEAPRELIQAIPGVELHEMARNRADSFCCGGGGGVMTGFPDWATKNAAKRIEESEDTGAEELVSICPFCFFNLGEGAKQRESSIRVRDLTELIDEALVVGDA